MRLMCSIYVGLVLQSNQNGLTMNGVMPIAQKAKLSLNLSLLNHHPFACHQKSLKESTSMILRCCLIFQKHILKRYEKNDDEE